MKSRVDWISVGFVILVWGALLAYLAWMRMGNEL